MLSFESDALNTLNGTQLAQLRGIRVLFSTEEVLVQSMHID